MQLGYIASTKQGSVLEQITNEMPKYGKHPICQTSIRRHNKLYNKGDYNYIDCVNFTDKHIARHVIDLATRTLHTKKCKKVVELTDTVEARIVNAKTTGLTLCECCK